MPCSRTAALILVVQRRRKLFFLSRRWAKAWLPACRSATRASRSLVLRALRKPFARFKILRRRLSVVVPLLTRVISFFYVLILDYALVPGRKRALSLFDMLNSVMRFRSSCLLRLSLDKKWFCPGFRARILPFFVTLSRFVNDLFVFMILSSLDYHRPTFWAFLRSVGYLVFDGHKFEHSL